MLAPADRENRWVAESLLCWRSGEWAAPLGARFGAEDMPRRSNGKQNVGPKGPVWHRPGSGAKSAAPYLADNGSFGAFWQGCWRKDYGAVVITTDNHRGADEEGCRRQHKSRKQTVETVNRHLEWSFGLHFPGAQQAGAVSADSPPNTGYEAGHIPELLLRTSVACG